jgi:hypothetical protein
MTTSINVDQQLGLIVAPSSPAVATDQALALILAPGSPAVAEDQQFALIIEQRFNPATIFNYIDQQVALIVERRNPRTQITGGHFQAPDGTPLANGYLIIRLSTDAMSPQGQLSAGISVTVPLGSDGNVSGFAALWATDLLDAGGNAIFYAVSAYSSGGQKCWGPYAQQIPNVPVYDIGNFSPTVPA